MAESFPSERFWLYSMIEGSRPPPNACRWGVLGTSYSAIHGFLRLLSSTGTRLEVWWVRNFSFHYVKFRKLAYLVKITLKFVALRIAFSPVENSIESYFRKRAARDKNNPFGGKAFNR